MCESGYITNNFWLGKKRSEEKYESITNEMNFVYKTSRFIPNIQPNIDIMKYVNTYDIGNYIALLYFYNKTQNGEFFNKLYHEFKLRKNQEKDKEEIEEKNNINIVIKEKEKNKDNFNRAFGYISSNFNVGQNKEPKYNKPFSKEMFHILLYCLWWVSNNMDGIKNYYRGINETFKIINNYDSIKVKFPIIDIDKIKEKDDESFETIVGKCIYSPIKNINFEYAQHFCKNEKLKRYSDCVETTVRNFINLLCFNGKDFDTTQLQNHFNINEYTIEYYKKYPTYDSQMVLEARDEWSRLVIYHANNNLIFKNTCKDNIGNPISHNIASGVKNKDSTKSNFFQLLQNVLSDEINIDKWKEQLSIINPLLTLGDEDDMNNEIMKTGIGEFTIIYNSTFIITFIFEVGHSYIEIINKDTTKIQYDYLNDKQQQLYISYLLNDKNYDNDKQYLWIKYTPEMLEKKYLNNNSYHFLELLSSELSNTDTRSRIYINTNKLEFYKYIKNYENEFGYSSDDFNFVDKIQNLRILNHRFLNKNIKEMPDMSPLKNIETIGDNFANSCQSLTKIDLSGLIKLKTIGKNFAQGFVSLTEIKLSKNIETIGRHFANDCKNLKTIDLSGLTNLKTIGYNFANSCESLTTIDLSGLTKLETIGDRFANSCESLTTINLSGLTILKTIGYNFAFSCQRLTTINLNGLTNLETIDEMFAYNCQNLTTINLSGLTNLKTIGQNFAYKCQNLTTIDLSGLTNLETIGDMFAKYCESLTTIDLSGLTKLKKIDNRFAQGCQSLTTIKLSGLTKLETIGQEFANDCKNLKTIDLSGLTILKTIGYNFAFSCQRLTTIDLSGLTNLETIDEMFAYNCQNLTTINLSGLIKLEKIGDGFAKGCQNLTTIDLSGLIKLEKIGEMFAYDCQSLTTINVSKASSNLRSIIKNYVNNEIIKEGIPDY